ncbi:MAG: hypothetical protein A2Y38_06600 [Spirochaetes bacterium GWB1_59_5]|nr:MAG: hypothetical protein A2Y38_06600 [Spirochaetes bacterium GWB1_59_5]
MGMSNRTYQIIHAIRFLAKQDEPATDETVASFLLEKKHQDRAKFSMAYISPSSMREVLLRLVTEEGYLTRESGAYHLTPKGSLLADLLDLLPEDTCSVEFLTNYKAHVAHGYLLSRHQLGLPAKATVNQVAEATGLSKDSAWRGCSEMAMAGLAVKVKDEYRLENLPAASAPPAVPAPPSPVDQVLAAVDESPLRPFDPPKVAPAPPVVEVPPVVVPSPISFSGGFEGQRNPVNAPPDALASDVPPDYEGEDENRRMGAEAEAVVDQAVAEAVVQETVQEAEQPPPPKKVGRGFIPAWLRVDLAIQKRFQARAQAMDLSLDDYLALLDDDLVQRARVAFLPLGHDRVVIFAEDEDGCEGCPGNDGNDGSFVQGRD